LSKIYSNIFIDEIQDLAGYDLDFIKLLFKSSSNILLVGDPRQVTYLTHHSRKYDRYSNGNIKKFVENELGKRIKCSVDEITLNDSHRNNQSICNFSSKLYPEFPTPNPCTCQSCRENPPEHEGIYLVNKADVENYLEKYNPVQLRWDIRTKVNENYNVMNFGASKGLTFDRVLIYPNEKMKKWIKNNSYDLKNETRAKFYVAITRARYSVGIVMDHGMEEYDGIEKYSPENNV
jgi:DNA helicase-2/ATP-dependent DNA helicase PcrA